MSSSSGISGSVLEFSESVSITKGFGEFSDIFQDFL